METDDPGSVTLWLGDLKEGSGTVTVGDGVFEGAYSFASRFEEGQGRDCCIARREKRIRQSS